MKKWDAAPRRVWSCSIWDAEETEETVWIEEEVRCRRLHFTEDAALLQRYIRSTGCSQEEAARRLGRSQSSVANRLRLLKLPEDVLRGLREGELTERHGRALLRLPTAEQQRQTLEVFCREHMSVAAAEAYAETLSGRKGGFRCAAISDFRVLFPSLNRDLETLRRCGICVRCEQRETDAEGILTIYVDKRGPGEKTREKS